MAMETILQKQTKQTSVLKIAVNYTAANTQLQWKAS